MPFIDNEFYSADAFSDELGGKPAPATLAKWRTLGIGPLFVLVGRTPCYRGSDIKAWLDERTVSHTNALIDPQKPTRSNQQSGERLRESRSGRRARAADGAA